MSFILFLLLVLLAVVVWVVFIGHSGYLFDGLSYLRWRRRFELPGSDGWPISDLDPLFAELAIELQRHGRYFDPEEVMRNFHISRERCDRLEQELDRYGFLEPERKPKLRYVIKYDSLDLARKLYKMGWIPEGLDYEVAGMVKKDFYNPLKSYGYFSSVPTDVLHKLGCIGRYHENLGYDVLIYSEKMAQEKIALFRDIYARIPYDVKTRYPGRIPQIEDYDPLYGDLALDLLNEDYFNPDEVMRQYHISPERCERLRQELHEFGLLGPRRETAEIEVNKVDPESVYIHLYELSWIPQGLDSELERMFKQEYFDPEVSGGYYHHEMAVYTLRRLMCIGDYVENKGYKVLIKSQKKLDEKIEVLREKYSRIPQEPEKEN